jgi:hypothetical protein
MHKYPKLKVFSLPFCHFDVNNFMFTLNFWSVYVSISVNAHTDFSLFCISQY